jgi:hypothetical protein
MYSMHNRWISLVAMATLGALCLSIGTDAAGARAARVSSRMDHLPRRTLWAWERPEDLHAVDPGTTAIAFLDQTIVLGRDAVSEPRRQPLTYPSGATLIAVVRIEASPGAALDDAQEERAVSLLLQSAEQPDIAALQVDFDATRRQRRFYADLLANLRRQMPAGLPLSITALASWCSNDDWIAALPVDEAVPMLFRMEPDRRNARPDLPQFRIREPLCEGSAGISTHEAWPEDLAGRRIYVFADRGWREDISLLAERKLP